MEEKLYLQTLDWVWKE